MRLEGVITNVANFGAFVDIGVGQDGAAKRPQGAMAETFAQLKKNS